MDEDVIQIFASGKQRLEQRAVKLTGKIQVTGPKNYGKGKKVPKKNKK